MWEGLTDFPIFNLSLTIPMILTSNINVLIIHCNKTYAEGATRGVLEEKVFLEI